MNKMKYCGANKNDTNTYVLESEENCGFSMTTMMWTNNGKVIAEIDVVVFNIV